VKPGQAIISKGQESFKRAKAMAMVTERIHGSTYKAIAAKFKCSIDTVKRMLDWADENGLVEKYEEQILQDLVPLAIQAYKDALVKGDTFVAKDVLSGMGITKKPRDAHQPKQQDEDLDLEIYLRKKTRGVLGEGSDNRRREGVQSQLSGNVAEGELLEGASNAPPLLGPGVVESHGENRQSHPEGFVGLPDYLAGCRNEQEVE